MQKEELLAHFAQLVPDRNWKRLGTTFQTANSKYFYDTGTGKVLECEKEADPLEYWRLDKICQQKDGEIKYNMNNANLSRVQCRIIADEPIRLMEQNGCCASGGRRLYVTTTGKFHVCERIGESPVIGDVENGMDLDAIKKYYVDEYAKESMPDCSKCWAVHLCSLCYAAFYDEKGIDITKKRTLCHEQRITARNELISYHQILEQNPAYLDRYCSEDKRV